MICIIFFFPFFFLNFILFLNFTNCISFAKYQNESTTGKHVFLILNPPPSSIPIPSLWVVPVHQPQASSIVYRTWTGNSFLHDILHVSMPFSQIFPPSPSPTESIRLFYTSVSLLHMPSNPYSASQWLGKLCQGILSEQKVLNEVF